MDGDGDGCRLGWTWKGARRRDAMHISCGEAHSIAVTFDGCLYAWGLVEGGRLGLGDGGWEGEECALKPVLVSSDLCVSDAVCGSRHTAVVVEEQDMVCEWGERGGGKRNGGGEGDAAYFEGVGGGEYDEYADEDLESDDVAVEEGENDVAGNGKRGGNSGGGGVSSFLLEGGDKVPVTLACGDGYTAAITSDKVLYTWGEGGAGQLGYQVGVEGSKDPKPVLLPSDMGVLHVACGAQVRVFTPHDR